MAKHNSLLLMCGVVTAVSGTDAKAGVKTATFSIPMFPAGAPYETSLIGAHAYVPLYQTNDSTQKKIWTPAARDESSALATSLWAYFTATSTDTNARFTQATAAPKEDEDGDINIWGLKYTPDTNYEYGTKSQDFGFITFTIQNHADAAFTLLDGDVWVCTATADAGASGTLSGATFATNMIWTKVPRSEIGETSGTAPNVVTNLGQEIAAGGTRKVMFKGIPTKVNPWDAGDLLVYVCPLWGVQATTLKGPGGPDTVKSQTCIQANGDAKPITAADDTLLAGQYDRTQDATDMPAYMVNFGSRIIKVNGSVTGGLRITPDVSTNTQLAIDIVDWKGPSGSAADTLEVPTWTQVQSKFVKDSIAAKTSPAWGEYVETNPIVPVLYAPAPIDASRLVTDEDFSRWKPLTSFWSSGSISFTETPPTSAGHRRDYAIYKRSYVSTDLGAMTTLASDQYASAGGTTYCQIHQFQGPTSGSAISKLGLFSTSGDTALTGWGSGSQSVTTEIVSGANGWGAETNDKIALVLSGTATEDHYGAGDVLYFVDKRYTTDAQGNCKKIEVCGSNVSYLPYLASTFGLAHTISGGVTADSTDASKEVPAAFSPSPTQALPAGQYDVYYEQGSVDSEHAGFKYPAKQGSVSVTINAPAATDPAYVVGTSFSDEESTVAKAYTFASWTGARFASESVGIVKVTVDTAPNAADEIALVPSGGGWSPADKASTGSLRAAVGVQYGCLQAVGVTSTSFTKSFYKCFNYFGPGTYTVWYRGYKANSPWTAMQATFTLTLTNGTGKQYVAKVRESASLAATGTGSYKYGDEEGQDGSTIGAADNGAEAGSFFPIKFNNWGDAYVTADDVKVNLSASASLTYAMDWKWGSTTTMADVSGTCYAALQGIDPNTGSDDVRDNKSAYWAGPPKWYDYPFGDAWAKLCNIGSADQWGSTSYSPSLNQGDLVGGSSYKVWVKIGALPWTLQSNAGFTLTALATPSDPTLGADFALTDATTGVQTISTTGETVSFSVATAALDRYALVPSGMSGATYVAGSRFGPLGAPKWSSNGIAQYRSDPSLKSSTTISIANVYPGVYDVYGREEGKDWVALTGVTTKIEWKPPASNNTPVVSAGGVQIVCSSGCTASAAVSSQNPTATSYTDEWNPYGSNQAQYTTSTFSAYRLELKFTASLSTSEPYEVYFAKSDTTSDANFYTTVESTSGTPSATELDTEPEAPGSQVGKNRSPCDVVGRESSTSIAFYTGPPSRTNERKTAKGLTVADLTAWDYRGFTVDANYYNAYDDSTEWTTLNTAATKTAGSSAKFGYFQYGVDNCQWGNGLKETWIFPSMGTYQACYRPTSGGFAGKRIYMDGSAPAADETDQRTYITVTLTEPPRDGMTYDPVTGEWVATTSPASTTSVMFAVLCVIAAMML